MVFEYKFGNWIDQKFLMRKTAGVNKVSKVRLMVEIND